MLHILTLEAIKHILKIIEHKNEHSLSIKSRSLTMPDDLAARNSRLRRRNLVRPVPRPVLQRLLLHQLQLEQMWCRRRRLPHPLLSRKALKMEAARLGTRPSSASATHNRVLSRSLPQHTPRNRKKRAQSAPWRLVLLMCPTRRQICTASPNLCFLILEVIWFIRYFE